MTVPDGWWRICSWFTGRVSPPVASSLDPRSARRQNAGDGGDITSHWTGYRRSEESGSSTKARSGKSRRFLHSGSAQKHFSTSSQNGGGGRQTSCAVLRICLQPSLWITCTPSKRNWPGSTRTITILRPRSGNSYRSFETLGWWSSQVRVSIVLSRNRIQSEIPGTYNGPYNGQKRN